nr:translation initiation factor IF-2-like [Manis javanica]
MAARRLRCPRRSLRETRRRRRGPPPLRSAPGRAGGPGERARAEEAEARSAGGPTPRPQPRPRPPAPRRTRPGRPVRRVCAPLPRRRPTPPSGQSARGGRGVEPAAPAQDPRARTPGFQDSTSGFFKNFQRFIYKLLHAHLRTNTICIQNRTVCKLNGVILVSLSLPKCIQEEQELSEEEDVKPPMRYDSLLLV